MIVLSDAAVKIVEPLRVLAIAPISPVCPCKVVTGSLPYGSQI